MLEKNSFDEISKLLGVTYSTINRRYRKHNPEKPLIKRSSSFQNEIACWLIQENIKFTEKNRTILKNKIKIKNLKTKELDFYLPDYKIGIEFNGTYWHMDPRKYKSIDYNEIAKKTAQEIWDKDKYKEDLCKSLDIKLIVIWEQDWKSNKEQIKTNILSQLS